MDAKEIFSPAVYLMNYLKYPRKFAVIGALFGITVATMLHLIILEINIGVELAEKERLGLHYLVSLNSLMHDVQQYRLASLAGDKTQASVDNKMDFAWKQADLHFKAMDVHNQRDGSALQTTERWQRIRARWQYLQRHKLTSANQEARADYRLLLQDMIQLTEHVGDTSNVVLDPDLDTYYLMTLVVNQIPLLAETATSLFAIAVQSESRLHPDSNDKIELAIRLSTARTQLDEIGSNIEKIYRANPHISTVLAPLVEEHRRAMGAFIKSCNQFTEGAVASQLTCADQADYALEMLESNYRLLGGATQSLEAGFVNRIRGFSAKKILMTSLVLTITAIVIYLFVGFYLGVVNTVNQISTTLEKIKGGDLSARAESTTKDELSTVAQGLNEMARELSLSLERREQAVQEISRQKELAEVTLYSIGDGVITTDASSRIEYLNPAAEELTGCNRLYAVGRELKDVFHTSDVTTHEVLSDPVAACLAEGRAIDFDKPRVLLGQNGRKTTIENFVAPIKDRQNRILGAVLVFHDISAAHEMNQRLSWQAMHDPLTGLLNRRGFEARLNQLLAHVSENNTGHAILYIDLDHFKRVNDEAGHEAGDELLKQLTAVLQTRIRDNDTFARLGGDEFAVLLENCSLDAALALANALLSATESLEFAWDENQFDIGISIGVASIRSGVDSLSHALKIADTACYAAKRAGRNRIHVAA